MENQNQGFGEDEISVLQNLFDSVDTEGRGYILINQLPGLLTKLGKSNDDIVTITESASRASEDGELSFENFRQVLQAAERGNDSVPLEGADPKVLEFCRILEEYRIKCEEEGNYLEAARALKQLNVLRTQEEKRQQKAIRARQISERQDVQLAHNMQFSDFNAAWDKYMEEYDNMAQMYIQQMTERHAVVLLEYQKQLREELANKPPKWSRELLEWRRRQHMLARRKNYTEAQKIKKIADRAEEKEREALEEQQAILFARKEAKFRMHQQAELQALLKRIEVRRKEHIKQREMDSKRLLQRNRNVQSVLESKQTVETHKLSVEIKKNLFQNSTFQNSNALSKNSTISSSNPGASKRVTRSNTNRGIGSAGDVEEAENSDFIMVDERDPPFMRQPGPGLRADKKGD